MLLGDKTKTLGNFLATLNALTTTTDTEKIVIARLQTFLDTLGTEQRWITINASGKLVTDPSAAEATKTAVDAENTTLAGETEVEPPPPPQFGVSRGSTYFSNNSGFSNLDVACRIKTAFVNVAENVKDRITAGESPSLVMQSLRTYTNGAWGTPVRVLVSAYNTLFGNNSSLALAGITVGGGAYDLFDRIKSAEVVIRHNNGEDLSFDCVSVDHDLTIEDVSIPVADFTIDKRTRDGGFYGVHKDIAVIQPFNFGLTLSGRGNPFESGNITLNGHDRLKQRDGSYFNYYQPKCHHTRTPADGVNVYSFALYPEKHQPSGTLNLSRIDTAMLNVNIADNLRVNNTMKLDIARDTRMFIFGFSYNVLRVMSGMGGVAYSN